MTISLKDVGSGFKRNAINENFTTLQNEINNNLLSKNGGVGLEADLDANSQKIINLAQGVNNTDAVNVQQLNGAISAASSGLIASQTETQKGSAAVSRVFTFSGITYTVGGNNLYVFQNGVKLAKGRDYTETSSSSITVDASLINNPNDDWDFITNIATTTSVGNTSAIVHTQSGTDYNLSTYLQNRHVVNVKDYGAVGDGVTDDTAAVQAADSIGDFHLPAGTYYVASNLTLSNNTSLSYGATIKPASGVVVTLNSISAPDTQVFDVSLGGSFVLTDRFAKAVWFGAVADSGTTDNGPLFNAAINAVGRAGTVTVQHQDINTWYGVATTILADFDELQFIGDQFRVRIGANSDIKVFSQSLRAGTPYFGLHVKDVDFFNNVISGTSSVFELNAAQLFRLDNVYIDKGPSHGFDFVGICAQGEINGCIAEECQGNGFNEASGCVMLSYNQCQSFTNDGRGFSSGGNTGTYGNTLTACKAYLNGQQNYSRGDAKCTLIGCMSRNGGTASSGTYAGIQLGSSAVNAKAIGCESFDDQGSPTQAYGFEINHFSQNIIDPAGSGNITGLVNNNEAQPLLTIAAGVVNLPTLPQNAIVRLDTEGATASDDLNSIGRGYTNQIVTFKTNNNARNVVFKDGVTNLSLAGDFTTTATEDRIVLQYDRTENRWVELSRSTN